MVYLHDSGFWGSVGQNYMIFAKSNGNIVLRAKGIWKRWRGKVEHRVEEMWVMATGKVRPRGEQMVKKFKKAKSWNWNRRFSNWYTLYQASLLCKGFNKGGTYLLRWRNFSNTTVGYSIQQISAWKKKKKKNWKVKHII